MTRRQRLEAVINGKITEELIADCKRELEKLNLHNEEVKMSGNYVENKEMEEHICEVLRGADAPMQVTELASEIGSTFERQRLTAICTNLIREGRIKSCDIKVKNKGKRKAYYID